MPSRRKSWSGSGSSASSRSTISAAPGAAAKEPRDDLLRRRELHELVLERLREAPVAEIPAVELLQEAGGAPLAQLAHRFVDEQDELGGHFLARRVGAVAEHHLADRPRIALRAAAHHDCGRACGREHGLRLRARDDVAGRDHRHVNELDELGRQRVIRIAGVHLLRRAGVERQGRRSRVHQPRAELEACARAVLDAPPHLHRHRHRHGRGDRLRDPAGEVRVLEQAGARARLRHLADGAAEVHVHDVGAGRLHHPGRLGHRRRVGAEDLDRERVLVGADAEIVERALVPVLDPGARDHLRADEPGAVAPPLPAEGLDAHTGHGGEDDPGRHLDRADPPGFAQFHGHAGMVARPPLTTPWPGGTIRPRRRPSHRPFCSFRGVFSRRAS